MKKMLIIFFIVSNWICFSQQDSFFDIVRRGTIDEAKTWILNKPDVVNGINEHSFSPLILACYNGNMPMVQFLIENNASIDYLSPEGTALMAATVKGNSAMVELLLKNGAHTDLKNESGVTALMYAVQFKNVSIIKMLLIHNANKHLIDDQGRTAFEYAVFTNDDKIINLLKNN
uniref:ankyrin repeat domain-containing protein n=1 Tax=Gelidibacter sp. TaxID=2018083 RepID=UPI004049E7CB